MEEKPKKPVDGEIEKKKEKEEDFGELGDVGPGMSGLVDIFGSLFSGGIEGGSGPVVKPSKVTGKSFSHWTDLTQVRELRLQNCPKLSDKDLKSLINLKNLEVLDLSGSNINGNVFKYTKDLTSVKELILLNCPRLSDKGLKHLNHLPNLEVLKISGADITGVCFKDWKSLKKLRVLSITGCSRLIDKNLRYLNELSALEKVDLSGTIE